MKIKPIKKLKLYGFNNLTKTLSFNFYDISYASKSEIKNEYISYIDDEYNATRLTNILVDVADIIGANVLNIASQDYDPQGASVTMLVAENHDGLDSSSGAPDFAALEKDTILAHLDKSHITVHTYPESHPDKGICTFRADIDVSTCGHISPLKALNYLLKSFEPDIAVIDYRVRGFTRDTQGRKFFIDHKINSIQNYIAPKLREKYQLVDMNIYQENIFMTKMIVKEFDLENYLFSRERYCLPSGERKKIKQRIQREMAEIFSGRNINKVKFKAKSQQEDGMAASEGLLEVPYND